MCACGFSSGSAFVPQEVTDIEMENAREELSQLCVASASEAPSDLKSNQVVVSADTA